MKSPFDSETPEVHAAWLVQEGVLRITDESHVLRVRKTVKGEWRNCRTVHRIDTAKGSRYSSIHIAIRGRVRTVKTHRLIWMVNHGACIPDGMQIDHVNGNKLDNRLSNLEVVTASENIRRSYANNRPRPWANTTEWRGRPRISGSSKAAMVEARERGVSLRVIAEEHGCSISHVQRLTLAS